jgi:hypothetical protein
VGLNSNLSLSETIDRYYIGILSNRSAQGNREIKGYPWCRPSLIKPSKEDTQWFESDFYSPSSDCVDHESFS